MHFSIDNHFIKPHATRPLIWRHTVDGVAALIQREKRHILPVALVRRVEAERQQVRVVLIGCGWRDVTHQSVVDDQ